MKSLEKRFARSLSSKLIRTFISDAVFTREELATALVVLAPRIDWYADGRERVPFDRQLCLAVLAIERAPYAHLGHTLKAQALAGLAFESHETAVHQGPPVSRVWKVY